MVKQVSSLFEAAERSLATRKPFRFGQARMPDSRYAQEQLCRREFANRHWPVSLGFFLSCYPTFAWDKQESSFHTLQLDHLATIRSQFDYEIPPETQASEVIADLGTIATAKTREPLTGTIPENREQLFALSLLAPSTVGGRVVFKDPKTGKIVVDLKAAPDFIAEHPLGFLVIHFGTVITD
jgi:hypothetical protein